MSAGLTTVVMILMLGQSRVLFAMSRDGLLPRRLATVHPRFGTPYRITIAVGVVVALMAGFIAGRDPTSSARSGPRWSPSCRWRRCSPASG